MFRFIFPVSLILCLGWQYAASSPVSVTEYEYVREADAWLRLHIVPANWTDAAVLCQLEGGVLATPTASSMVQAMMNQMEKYRVKSDFVHIGATSRYSEGEIKSLDGEDLPRFLAWNGDELYSYESIDKCLAMTQGLMTAVSCARVLPYFCRKTTHNCSHDVRTPTEDPNVDLPTTSAASKCSTGYEWSDLTGSCYRFHHETKMWREALAACQAEGAHLVIINSDTESSVLQKIFRENPGYTIFGTDGLWNASDYALIGFVDWERNGNWITINGEPLAEAGFDKWSPGEPDHVGGENCGSIHRDGLLNDINCHRKFPFICEFNP